MFEPFTAHEVGAQQQVKVCVLYCHHIAEILLYHYVLTRSSVSLILKI